VRTEIDDFELDLALEAGVDCRSGEMNPEPETRQAALALDPRARRDVIGSETVSRVQANRNVAGSSV